MVNVEKKPLLNLTKGQTISLTKDGNKDSEKLTNVYFGASWGKIKSSGLFGFGSSEESVDLDASLVCYDAKGTLYETIYYANRHASNGSIHHSGDDLVGGGKSDSDNETISIDLNKVNKNVEYIVAVLNSFSGQKFDKLPYMKLRIYTGNAGDPDEVLCAYNIENNSDFKGKTCVVLGYFYRKDGAWKFRADGRTGNETRIHEIERGIAKSVI